MPLKRQTACWIEGEDTCECWSVVCMVVAKMALEHRTGKERARTHTHTQQYTPFLDLVRLVAGSHYLELWDEAGIACVRCVCVHVCPGCECEGLSVRRDVCVCVGGRLSLMNPPGLRVFHWRLLISPDTARSAAEHGPATNRHASVSIRRRCPFSGARARTHTHTHTHTQRHRLLQGQGRDQCSHSAHPRGEHLILTRRRWFCWV